MANQAVNTSNLAVDSLLVAVNGFILAGAAGGSLAPGTFNRYSTIGGEMWDQISRKIWGKEKWANVLIRANPQYADVVTFDPGIQLIIPAVDTANLISPVPWGSVYVLST